MVWRSSGSSSSSRSHHSREDSPAVDVAAQQHRGVGVERHPHINDFGRLEVDLRGAARPFYDDDVVLVSQSIQRSVD